MNNNNVKNKARQTQPPNVTQNPTHEKTPQIRMQAKKLVDLYHQIRDTGVIPEPESYEDLGETLSVDMAELIRQYKIDGVPGMDEAFDSLVTTDDREHKEVMRAEATYTAPAKQEETQPQEDEKRFVVLPTGSRVLRLYSIGEVFGFEDPEDLIAKVLGVANVSVLFGKSGTGKTFTSLHLGLTIAHGIEWYGHRVKQGIVWYINAEGNRNFKKRLKAWYKEHPHLEKSPNFHVIPWAVDLKENFQDLLNTITYTIESTGETPVLIIIDNFSTCTEVDQTKQELVTPILKNLNTLAQDYGSHVMVIHHTNKEDDFNGSMAFRNHVDTMIQLKKADKADKHSPILLCCEKPRDDEPFKDIKTELKQVVLYTDERTLETVTSCVVVESQKEIQIDGLRDTPQNCLDILGNRTLSYTQWKKECLDELKITKVTFDRSREELVNKAYVKKYRPDGQKFEQYCAASTENAKSLEFEKANRWENE